ncbi:MAG: FAD-dependent oxidoreductase [Nannocystaceae bacterium]
MGEVHFSSAGPRPASTHLDLGIAGSTWAGLHEVAGLAELKRAFDLRLGEAEPELAGRWRAHEDGSVRMSGAQEGELLIAVARHVSAFIAHLFGVARERDERRVFVDRRNVVYRLSREFYRPHVQKVTVPEAVDALDVRRRAKEWVRILPGMDRVDRDEEEQFAGCVLVLCVRPPGERAMPSADTRAGGAPDASSYETADATGQQPTVAEVLALLALDLRLRRDAGELGHWRSLRGLRPVDSSRGRVRYQRSDTELPEALEGLPATRRRRDGFKLTDPRATASEVLNEIEQCLFCHARGKDSCRTGLHHRQTLKVLRNSEGIELEGCPLEERISEMQRLYGEGDPLAALALVMIDNPMCPGTGHRICNDCMKSCVFQKQEPVNIPEIETRVLTDVLDLPYGPELYLLLTRWNPLRVERPYPVPYNGINVMVVGMGPAGYTLAHYLCMEGFGVVGIDGLKIEPLPENLVRTGEGSDPPPVIARVSDIMGSLDERVLLGFGGVSEYGITVRWDKNFLSLCYLSLLRREHFVVHGGTRFGGTIELEDAWKAGFDHVAIATGAGKPTIVKMKNNLSRGIRKASDFLMALQLTGAFKRDAFANLQLTLPVVVIGGGLTGIDTATEALAYYPVQVEKIVRRYEALCGRFAEKLVRLRFDQEEALLLDEMLRHGREVLAERERARGAEESPDFVRLVRGWGGVKLVYRKTLEDSPAYRLNHEEVVKALEEGITFVETLAPLEALLDGSGAVRALLFERQAKNADGRWRGTGHKVELPARSVLVAAGTSPNVIYEKEHPGTLALDQWKWFFEMYRESPSEGLESVVRGRDETGVAFFTSYSDDHRHRVTVYGDNHPVYAGNVVKAMASAKHGYLHVVASFKDRLAQIDASKDAAAGRRGAWQQLVARIKVDLDARVHEVNRLTPTITEVVVHAPAAARKFRPGQFYRLQDFEFDARRVRGTKLMLEGIALTGAWKDDREGLLGMIVLELGVSSRLCALLRPGQRVVVMGPTGAPTEIPRGERIILLGGGLGNAVLFSIGKAMRDAGNEVLYFAGFQRGEDLFKREQIEEAADVVMWSTDSGAAIVPSPSRPRDRHVRGNIVQAMLAYSRGDLGDCSISLDRCDRLVVIGSDRMMNAVREARRGAMKPYLKPDHLAIGSINSPMQCMMKEICAQCLCKQIDPGTGAEVAPVFSCFNQDQMLDAVDFGNLEQRLRQNTVQEKLSGLWLDHLIHTARLPTWTSL